MVLIDKTDSLPIKQELNRVMDKRAAMRVYKSYLEKEKTMSRVKSTSEEPAPQPEPEPTTTKTTDIYHLPTYEESKAKRDAALYDPYRIYSDK